MSSLSTSSRSRLIQLLREVLSDLEEAIDAAEGNHESLPCGIGPDDRIASIAGYLEQLDMSPDARRLLSEADALWNRTLALVNTDQAKECPEQAEALAELFGTFPAPLDDDEEHRRIQEDQRVALLGQASRFAKFVRELLEYIDRTPVNVNAADTETVGESALLSQAVASPSGTNSAKRNGENDSKPSNINLRYWAVGVESRGNWWLFRLTDHGKQPRWENRGKIDIPAGNPQTVLLKFVENGGSLSNEDATKLLPAPLNPKRRRRVTEALSKARKLIREAIARAKGVDVKLVPDPLPHGDDRWISNISIGLATQDDHGQLTFTQDHT